MHELIKMTTDENGNLLVSGRELHKYLEVKTRYNDWFVDMLSFGFTENVDFTSFTEKRVKPQGGRPSVDHAMTLDMAKEISMIQRTDKGREARHYFIAVEKQHQNQVQIPTSKREMAKLALLANEETNQRVDELDERLKEIEENKLITTEDKGTIDSRVRKKIYCICKEQRLGQVAKNMLFQDLGSSIKQVFNVPNRGRIKDKDFIRALNFIDTWEPSSVTKERISQMSLDVDDIA